MNSILDILSPFNVFAEKEFPPGSIWPNLSEPLRLEDLKGNVVILDFWTYCCINCMHMLHELEEVEKKYRDSPVIVIGVHSAKFANEKDKRNIENAIARYDIRHPVVMDNDMKIWRAYGSQGWPTIMIIDPAGKIVYRQSGEGQVTSIEQTVDRLLEDAKKNNTLKPRVHMKLVGQKEHGSILSYPGKLALSPDGSRLAVSDSGNNRILIIDLKNNVITTAIGGTKHGFADGNFAKALFYRPQGVAWPKNDIIYVADTDNHSIRQIDLDGERVSTIAGTGHESNWLALGGDALKIALNSPWDIAYSGGTLYIAMAGTHQIWKYNIDKKDIRPFAGSGYEGIEDGKGMGSLLAQPSGLYINGDYIYFVDSEASAIRRASISTQRVETLVGTGLFDFGYRDGRFGQALFQHPLGICTDDSDVYVADTYNGMIRALDLKKGEVSIVVGGKDHYGMCRFDDPKCDVLGLYEPGDVKIGNRKLYIADTNNHLIRAFDFKEKVLTTLELSEGRKT